MTDKFTVKYLLNILFILTLFGIVPNQSRGPASSLEWENCAQLAVKIIARDREESFLERYLSDHGVVLEISESFRNDLGRIYPSVNRYQLDQYQSRFQQEMSYKLNELLDEMLSAEKIDYDAISFEIDLALDSYLKVVRNQIFSEISEPMKLSFLLSDKSFALMPDQIYVLSRLNGNPTDNIEFITFSHKVINELDRNLPDRTKALKACENGLVLRAHGVNGIKRIRGDLYEIKNASMGKRYWGCLEGSTLSLIGVTDHKGIARVSCP